jgi:hypothetical protein
MYCIMYSPKSQMRSLLSIKLASYQFTNNISTKHSLDKIAIIRIRQRNNDKITRSVKRFML